MSYLFLIFKLCFGNWLTNSNWIDQESKDTLLQLSIRFIGYKFTTSKSSYTRPLLWTVTFILTTYPDTHIQQYITEPSLDKGAGFVGIKGGANVTRRALFWYILETRRYNAFQPPRGGAFCQCYNHSITRVLLSFQHGTRDQTFFADRFMSFVCLPTRAGVTLGSCAVAQALLDKVYGVRSNEL